MPTHDTDPSPPPSHPPCDLVRELKRRYDALSILPDTLLEHTEKLRHQIDRLEIRLDWLETAGETTMAETVKAKMAQAEDRARLELTERALMAARLEGAKAGATAAGSWRSQRKSLAGASAAFLVALSAFVPQIVQACSAPAQASSVQSR